MLLILWCCDHIFRAPSLVCPFWSVCIWVLSVVTLRNWLCSGSHQIVVVLSQRSSDSTHHAPRVSCEKKKKKKKKLWPCSQGVTEGASVVSGQSLLSLDWSCYATWYWTGMNRCWHRHSLADETPCGGVKKTLTRSLPFGVEAGLFQWSLSKILVRCSCHDRRQWESFAVHLHCSPSRSSLLMRILLTDMGPCRQ